MLAHEVLADGEGAPVVFLHGFLGSGRNLHSLARRLTGEGAGRRGVLVDHLGHGSSPALPPGSTHADLAGALAATLRALPFDGPFELVGHSLGGRVGLALVRDAPALVRGLHLLDISPDPVPSGTTVQDVVAVLLDAPASAPDRDSMRAHFTARDVPRPMADWLLMNLVRTPEGEMTWRIDREALAEAQPRWSAEDLWEVVETEGSPVRSCVRGGESPFVPDPVALRLEQAGVRVETLEGAGHFVHMEAMGPLVEVLDGWLPRG